MTKFEGTFQGRTTGGFGGITISASGVLALVGAAVVLTHRHQAGEALSGAVIAVAVVVGTVLAAGITYAVVRVRGNRRTAAAGRPLPLLMRTNPNALPPREPRAIAPATVVNVNLGDALTAFLREQATPVYRATAETVKQQEIPR